MALRVIVRKLYSDGCSMIPSGGGEKGKSPQVQWRRYQNKQVDSITFKEWLERWHGLWGMVTGGGSKRVVVDVDPGADPSIMDGLELHVKTPRGGGHYYFCYPAHRVKTCAGILPHIDIRGDGGFVNVVVKNPVIDGRYSVKILPTLEALYPWERMPKAILDAMNQAKPPPNKPTSTVDKTTIAEGERNSTLTSLAGSMRCRGMTAEAIESALMVENKERCQPPLNVKEVRNIVKSVCNYEPAKDIRLTDATNAEYLAELHGDELRYDHKRGRWIMWSGHYWRSDKDGVVSRLAIEAARTRLVRAAALGDLYLKKRVTNWAITSENRVKVDACLSLAKRIKPFADEGVDWDRQTMLLGAENGVIDLRTGKLRPGKPEDMITMSVGFDFNPSAKCPRWDQFLEEIFDDNTELVDWLWRVLGYTISGDTTEHIFMMGYGEGANGKSRFCNAILTALSDYAYSSPFSTFSLPAPSSTNDLAAVELKRFVTSSETNAGTRLNIQRIKALSGEDPMTARYLYKEFETFVPQLKIWLFVNHKPEINDDTIATWRRVRLIPFTKTFIKEKADNRLGEKLRAEAPGILAWLVQGCLEWQKRGLAPVPECIRQATGGYMKESDPIMNFLEECCVQGEDQEVRAQQLYIAFREWMKGERKIPSQVVFGRRMSAMVSKRQTARGFYYEGVGLRRAAIFKDGRITVNLDEIPEESY